jgi:hypothetical protein
LFKHQQGFIELMNDGATDGRAVVGVTAGGVVGYFEFQTSLLVNHPDRVKLRT